MISPRPRRNILNSSMPEPTERTKLLNKQQVLVLSTGFEPMFKTGWQRALSAVMSGRAEIIESHDTLWIGTPTGKVECPTVVRFTTGVIAAKLKVDCSLRRPTKKLLWIRDEGKCQYCSKNVTCSSATIDHVLPKSRGGKHTWDNLVISCSRCNGKKGDRLPKECNMNLLKEPAPPLDYFLPLR